MEKHNKRTQSLMKAIKFVHSLASLEDLEKQRLAQESLGTIFSVTKEVVRKEIIIDNIECEWTEPNRKHDKNRIIMYCHGGGYMTGNKEYARTITTKLAMNTSMEVFSFNYRLAPEFPYPAALEDAISVWNYLMYQGYGSKDIILAGDSAGGNLALALTLKLREQMRKEPKGLVLLSPWTDLTLAGESHQIKADLDPILDKEYLMDARDNFVGKEDITIPFISPLLAEFDKFPPVYIQVGSNEILLSDSMNLYKKLVKSGNFARIDIYKGMWHVFQMSNFKKAQEAVESIADFIFEIYER
ncbi:alpha/beta hydrolase [Anaerosacchariphilus polymeriproducens]|uniref:Alpha/beta hydrolase n=1 Tax=Anaerosacchariphilus polymeriproducens TaxID=1812858 RepID=A0A371AXX1_9FIRM|nr:alpha/beta hydrolase [Anaerosacchariphilus polymeriproducens]RDU24413.1 alpha/beta hydrolase [Anaerosacchariphilus polymeriproducens]